MYLKEIVRISDGPGCDDANCPAIYVSDDPGVVVVQGKVLDSATIGQLTGVGADELAVAIPLGALLNAADVLRGGR
jgi:hypothetical protein